MVQAVAETTLRTAESLETFGETFRGRLAALARLHAALWRSQGAPVGLRDLVALSVAPFGHDGGRASMDGDDVLVPIESAGTLGLVLHELVTNAVKHGALSVASGNVRVEWRVEEGGVRLGWRESGGPAVIEPSRRGFGTVLIEQSIPYELGGSTALEFAPSGVGCTIWFPLPERWPRPQDTAVNRPA
jgi:two-component sensor histidine kinase